MFLKSVLNDIYFIKVPDILRVKGYKNLIILP